MEDIFLPYGFAIFFSGKAVLACKRNVCKVISEYYVFFVVLSVRKADSFESLLMLISLAKFRLERIKVKVYVNILYNAVSSIQP